MPLRSASHVSTSHRERVWADLALLLVAAIWGSAFVAQRTAASQIGPFAFNAARFALGGLLLLPFVARRRQRPSTHLEWRGGVLLGLLLFASAALQQIGLAETTAGKAGFITGLYIVIVPLLLAIVWREQASWSHWLGAGLAVIGLFLLSVQSEFTLAPGDGWVLVGAFGWSLHVIAIGRLAPGRDPVKLALIQFAVCAALSTGVALFAERPALEDALLAWPEIVYTGLMSIGLGYTLQVAAQRHTPPSHTAILLSLETVFAASFGWLLLGETLNEQQIVGCGLMLAGIGLAQARVILRGNTLDFGKKA